MAQSRRNAVQNVSSDASTHAGLWFDKYLDTSIETDKIKPGNELVKQTAALQPPREYWLFYNRWVNQLQSQGAMLRIARADSRLAVSLGADSVIETAIALHRTYGVPYIPGSAIKGLAAFYARNALEESVWGKETDAYRILFGDTKNAGFVTFFDALYVPRSGNALKQDVITVHHPDYYQGQEKPPADWDNPNPIPFLTSTGNYLFALAGEEAWVNAAYQILENALARNGIGAKTSSGYGRMHFKPGEPLLVKTPLVKSFSQSRFPSIGDRFKGTIFDVDDSGVFMEIPGIDADELAYAFLPAGEYPESRQFQDDQKITCEVIGFEEDSSGCYKVVCILG